MIEVGDKIIINYMKDEPDYWGQRRHCYKY